MGIGRIIAYIAATFLLVFALLFIWGAFSPDGNVGWIVIGLIQIAVAAGLILWASRKGRAEKEAQNVTLKIDLPGNVSMDTLKCQSCGGALTPENITMVAGAPVVKCPYCHTTYQLTEEPKW